MAARKCANCGGALVHSMGRWTHPVAFGATSIKCPGGKGYASPE